MTERVQKIKTAREIQPTIYAYITPTNTEKQGWVKIGYTDRDAETRVKEQTHTAGLKTEIIWEHSARFNDGAYFLDTDFHSYLQRHGIEREKGTEWFYFDGDTNRAEEMFMSFTFKKGFEDKGVEGTQYKLRSEQEEAVTSAFNYFTSHGEGSEFLWNAKPRFGKTLSAYDLVRRLDANNVLIVTNRPAIANSWFEDYEKFIEWQTDYKFVTESPSLAKYKDRTFTRSQFAEESYKTAGEGIKQIAFVSLQDLKGSKYFGGGYDKLRWVSQLNWDVLIIDEAHEGIDTDKTDTAFDQLKRKYTLHLSGTPFKQIANNKFTDEQIYNWSYVDEQTAKSEWDEDTHNPYENLPKLNMFTYQMSQMIRDEIVAGADDEQNLDYAFDLNEFFSTNDAGRFIYEKDVLRWLDTLTDNEKYPFSTPELRKELRHTFWFLDRVASARALEKLLKQHKVFENYEIIVAAGQTTEDDYNGEKNKEALDRVRQAIKHSGKPTITLSVGQLTTGVTVPEWGAVLMLNNVKSPALYMQAAFRAQNPYQWEEKDSRGIPTVYQKKNAYIFDFAPERTLSLFDDFANNLNPSTASGLGTTEEREENIRQLLNFFPVIGEDEEGRMVELDAQQVMTIPKNIKAHEVVRRGFMSNLLFANIAGIFQAPQAVVKIINQFSKTEEGKSNKRDVQTKDFDGLDVDDHGEINVEQEIVINTAGDIFGEKRYDLAQNIDEETVENIANITENGSEKLSKDVSKTILNNYKESRAFDHLKEEFDLTAKKVNQHEKVLQRQLEETMNDFEAQEKIRMAHAQDDLKEKESQAQTEAERQKIVEEFKLEQKEISKQLAKEQVNTISKAVENWQNETVEKLIKEEKEKQKSTVEDDVRSRLRGFARTIPSFIMAYGDRELTLENFDTYTPDDVFKEVTGITLDEFRFLRDGGEYKEEDGEIKIFRGNLFDEIVFNQSVQEFLDKKEELANYFEDTEEDIFDYIPNQKTNQIFTPKWVVQKMVDQLEEENSGIYDDSSKTFIDLYMKSGLYITEIVKRLYNSEVIKKEIPDNHERLKHILENQVYGLAPTEIIYRIALSYIFSEATEGISKKNFKKLDAYPYAEAGTLEEKLDEVFE